jgi:hypothetical protein
MTKVAIAIAVFIVRALVLVGLDTGLAHHNCFQILI